MATRDQAPTKGAQTRQAILDAAIARFGRDGYRATSVADIARDAGVGGTVAYAYFPNKEALFLAALDEDAAAVIHEGLVDASSTIPTVADWRQTLIFTLVGAVERHPLARRLLAGLEPEVTDRVLEIPALAELRKACAERLRAEQLAGTVRPDIDPVAIGNGVVVDHAVAADVGGAARHRRRRRLRATTSPPCSRPPSTRRRCADDVDSGADTNREDAGAADLAARPAHGVGVGELEHREALEPHLEGDPQLHAGQVRAGAAVDAEAERGVAVDLAVDDHLVGPLEHLGIAVGRRERQQHPVLGLHRAAVEVHVLA